MHDAGEVLQRDVVYFTTGTSFSKMRKIPEGYVGDQSTSKHGILAYVP